MAFFTISFDLIIQKNSEISLFDIKQTKYQKFNNANEGDDDINNGDAAKKQVKRSIIGNQRFCAQQKKPKRLMFPMETNPLQ